MFVLLVSYVGDHRNQNVFIKKKKVCNFSPEAKLETDNLKSGKSGQAVNWRHRFEREL